MKLLIKLLLSLGMLAYLFTHVHYHEVFSIMKNIQPLWFIFAILLMIFATLLAAYRWKIIMQLLQFNATFSFFYKSYFKGCFFNQLLPTSIGGDAYRVIELGQHHHYNKKKAFFGIFVDRVYGYLGLMFINLLANFSHTVTLPKMLVLTSNALTLGGFAAGFILINFHRLHFIPRVPGIGFIKDLSKAAHDSFRNGLDLGFKFLLSIGIALITVLAVYCIGLSLNLTYPLVQYLLIIPLVNVILLLPISMAGWGLREGAMVSLFALNGASKPEILSLSLLLGVCMLLNALPGLYFWLRKSS